uniref:Collagen-like protein n=1 Tax=Macrostomum lignano TaxID=282301 RepID=A0A1I8JS18_9PLAT
HRVIPLICSRSTCCRGPPGPPGPKGDKGTKARLDPDGDDRLSGAKGDKGAPTVISRADRYRDLPDRPGVKGERDSPRTQRAAHGLPRSSGTAGPRRQKRVTLACRVVLGGTVKRAIKDLRESEASADAGAKEDPRVRRGCCAGCDRTEHPMDSSCIASWRAASAKDIQSLYAPKPLEYPRQPDNRAQQPPRPPQPPGIRRDEPLASRAFATEPHKPAAAQSVDPRDRQRRQRRQPRRRSAS